MELATVKRCARRWRLEIHGQPLFEVLRRCYHSGRMASGPRSPRLKWRLRTGHRRGSQRPDSRGLATAFLLPLAESGPPLTWAPPPGSCGQRGELGDTSKSFSSSASPAVRGRFQGPGGGHGCSMSGCPRLYNPHCQQTWRQ